MSGDCKQQPLKFYSDHISEAKRILLEKYSDGTYLIEQNNMLYQCRWRTGSVMQE